MARFALLLALALTLSALQFDAGAQPQQPPPSARAKKSAARVAAGAAEADPLAEARRTTAVMLINALADDARNFRDQTLRARAQARAADALWETDREKASALFRRAWEAAEAADQENERLSGEERAARRAARGSASVRNLPSMRREVLRLAAKRDRALGEEFLARLDEARKKEAEGAAAGASAGAAADAAAGAGQRFNPDDPPTAWAQRLSLARQLLDDGDAERAVQFADPALFPVNTFGINFLDTLREKNAAAADERYAALLARAAASPQSDANSVSLLASYAFTPYLYMTFNRDGNGHSRLWSANKITAPDLSPQLRAAFFRAAASVLLRPVPPAEQDRTSTGRAGTYAVISRLTPLFEQHAPDIAPRLRTHLAALTPDTPERLRNPNDRRLTEGLVPEDDSPRDRVPEILDRVERAQSGAERDTIYAQAAMTALRQGELPRARELAARVEDLEVRRQLRGYIDFDAVNRAVRDKKAEEALALARGGELTSVQRAWGMTEAARLVAKTQPGRAAEMLEEALVEAKRVDAASPDRPRAVAAIVTQLLQVDRTRAWEATADLVKAANAAAEFTGEDGGLVVRVQMGQGASTMEFPVQTFNLPEVFGALAREDFTRAVDLAKALTGEYPRAVATLAVARAGLEKKKP